jgi:hypothetical protein
MSGKVNEFNLQATHAAYISKAKIKERKWGLLLSA